MQIESFEDLEVWKYCRELKNELTELAKSLPAEEKYRLSDQIIKASRSLTNNIAEGYGRFHFRENIQFCRISRGSLYECIDHLYCCLDDSYIDKEYFDLMRPKCIRGIQLLNGYIRFLNKQKFEFCQRIESRKAEKRNQEY